jgi:uncharacterized protein YhfF
MENKTVVSMWNSFLATIGEDETTTKRKYTAWHFCDNERCANALADLVLEGTKRATASLYLTYEHENEEIPKAGDYSIVTDWSGTAKCIIQTIKVDLMPYQEVSETFARTEGEGDKSLDYWRKAHWPFFTREMESMGKEPTEDMLVVCEEFRVVYPE